MPNTPSIKCEKIYRALRREGHSKESAARISNAAYNRGKCGGKRKEMSEQTFFVTKDAKGEPRWVLVSSSAYVDRDGEIVTEKALIKAVERMDAGGDYGELRWWHTPVVLGSADFAAVHDHHLIESGTFVSKQVAARVMAAAGKLGASIGFRHPASEPAGGLYSDITIKERSLLPRGREANLFTTLSVVGGGEMEINADKRAKLLEVMGEEDGNALLASVSLSAKAADEAGVTRKEKGLGARFWDWFAGQPEIAEAAKEADAPEEDEEDEPDADAEAEGADGEAEAVTDAPEAEAGKATKEDDPDAMPVTRAELKAALAAIRKEIAGSSKEAGPTKAEVDAANAAAAKAQAEAEKAAKAIAALTSELPRGVAGIFRASQAAETVTDKAEKAAEKTKELNDPLVAWVDSKFGG